MKLMIVDDEAPARQRLRGLISELGGDYEVTAEAENGEQAVALSEAHPVDLVFMDIHMPGMDGLEAAAHISRQEPPPAIIFITAYSEHALDAFEVNAVDYLLKPIRRQKLQAALEKATRLTRPLVQKEAEAETWLTSRYRGGVQRIALSDVYYFRADSKYVMVRHGGGESLLEDSLVSLEKRFPQELLRIHRSMLVRTAVISGLVKNLDGGVQVVFADIDDRLDVSRRHVPAVRRLLNGK
ncbi:LytR/AlgR family response regulator transcription factor [Thiolapillus sp.]|uniref:LytR/AlgR family response regulator transcription factor n=12 Tax=Thiolapillus sp. TaxID=2017437 RepID=UPI0025CC0D2B|nr:LytTR family DNA-binding domain-containing protein [Thiolapillus sp.]